MMNMMNRFVEGRGHQREIDMLLEITCVGFICVRIASDRRAASKSKAVRFVRWEMQQLGQFKD
jgi:hypothetical protein